MTPAWIGRLILNPPASVTSQCTQSATFQPSTPSTYQFGSNPPVQTYNAALIQGTLQVGPDSAAQVAQGIEIVLDTGAPVTTLHAGTPPHDQITPAFAPAVNDPVTLNVTLQDSNTTVTQSLLNFNAGTDPGYNVAHMNPAAPVPGIGYINAGLTAYWQYQVMFDLVAGRLYFPPARS